MSQNSSLNSPTSSASPVIFEPVPTPPNVGSEEEVSIFDEVLNELLAPNIIPGWLRFFVLVIAPIIIVALLSKLQLTIIDKDNWPLLILFVLPFLIAFELAALYIQTLYGLTTVGMARRVLLATAFGLTTEVIRIQNGVKPESRTSPLLQVGGPGFIQVHYDSAALVERPNGQPYIIGPTTKYLFGIEGLNFIPIKGFDRLRESVDLRDHVMEWEVKGRTKDGIQIKASNLQVVFSVRRGQFRSRIQNPNPQDRIDRTYPFYPLSIYRLIYEQQLNKGALEAVIQPLIRNEFRNFIERNSLKELLTSIRNSDTQGINQNFLQRYLAPGLLPVTTTRPEISGIFTDFSRRFSRETSKAGIEMEWINIGVWQLDADRIIQQHIDAWKMEFDNRNMTATVPLTRLSVDMTNEEVKFLLQDVLKQFLLSVKSNKPQEEIIHQVLLSYAGKLRRANDEYLRNGEPVPANIASLIQAMYAYQVFYASTRGAQFI